MYRICTVLQLQLRHSATALLLAGLATGTALAQAPAKQPTAARGSVKTTALHSPYAPTSIPKRAVTYFENVWGVDSFSVKAAESGELIRFKYRVLDPRKASQLNDKKAVPTLVDPRARVSLVVPSLEKVGQLRQSGTPEEGKVYWMAFSNPRRTVKPGDRVNVVIGNFHADGLIVE
ncbi:MAG TPA: hypothetical protein VK747_05350 [Blastocatellia bacterium]|nr:hypothetical protein [Blastocatellia bacterium]